jgi:magnesium chelatase accessory protein
VPRTLASHALHMPESLDWSRDGKDWPHREHSTFVTAGGLRWHVQRMGETAHPVLLLLHGTGAATHSWRDLMPALAKHFDVVAPDLPGHGFTGAVAAAAMTLPGMARSIGDLLRVLKLKPAIVVGHSAGAAILARMCLDHIIAPRALISVNGALLPLPGLRGEIFSPVAKLLASAAWVPRVFAWRANNPAVVERLIGSTGSKIDDAGMALYGRLVRNPGHAAAALAMMANWDLASLARDLPTLQVPLQLVVGMQDGTVPPSEAERVARMVSVATVEQLEQLGHLAHEESPQRFVEIITRVYASSFPKQARSAKEHS